MFRYSVREVLTKRLTIELIESLEKNGGGKEWAGLVFPHPTILKNQLAKSLVKLAFSKLEFLLDIFQSS